MYTWPLPSALATLTIETAHPAEMSEFYRNALDLGRPLIRSHNHVGFRIGSIYLGFDRISEAESQQRGPMYLWFAVEDLTGTFERFARLGATIGAPPMGLLQGDITASVLDPEGNVVCLAQRRDGTVAEPPSTRIERLAANSIG
jgi:predicted enzyme related to lactoylglutathione lyase